MAVCMIIQTALTFHVLGKVFPPPLWLRKRAGPTADAAAKGPSDLETEVQKQASEIGQLKADVGCFKDENGRLKGDNVTLQKKVRILEAAVGRHEAAIRMLLDSSNGTLEAIRATLG